MTSRRQWTSGLLDQGVVAAAGAGNGLLATAVLPPDRAGAVMASIATVHVAIGLCRAFIGDVLLTHASRYPQTTARRLHGDAAATALTCGIIVAGGFAVLSWAWPDGPLAPLRRVAPFLPVILLHDTARHSLQAQRRQDRALAVDLVWITVQAVVLVAQAATTDITGGGMLAAWGIGAGAAAVAHLLRGGTPPWHGRPHRWLTATGKLSGWFTGTALIGQTQAQLIALAVPVLLGPAGYAGLRLAQLVILQPVQNLVLASMGILVPRTAAAAAAGDTTAVRHQTRTTLVVALGLSVVVILGSVIAVRPVLEWYRDGAYTDIAPLVWPVSIQAAVYLMQIPFTAALRGTQAGARLFTQYALFTTISLAGAMIGARTGGPTGTAWGLTVAAVCGGAAMAGLSHSPLRRPPVQLRPFSDNSR